MILGSAKMKEMLASFYKITENVRAVADGELLDIGERKLQFFNAPFVHWPETMVTYDTAEKILFSCDAFGGYGALVGTIFDDECRNITLLRAGVPALLREHRGQVLQARCSTPSPS